ncbi:MAG: hypothetical protein RIT45_2141 [Pseudomonadota bacterium]|jgi:hypothetical protein
MTRLVGHRSFAALLGFALLLGVGACGEEPTTTRYATLEPAAPVLPRLTRSQYVHTVTDVFGDDLALPAQLEPDVASWGLLAVGASVATVSSRGVELYEEAARSLAAQIVGKPGRLGDLLPCSLPEAGTVTCTDALVARYAPRLWRRPATTTERDRIVAIAQKAHTAYGTEAARVEYALVALLQSPNLLYRTEIGVDDGKNGPALDAYELAGKLALFLWDGPPDDVLLATAADGTLMDDAVLQAQAERMVADARFRRAIRAFALQWLHLDSLDGLNKDPNVFKHFSADLGGSAKEEALRLFAHLVVDEDADIAELLTTRTAFVDRRLAAIYDVPAAVDDGFGRIELPAGGLRRGFLGQVAFLGAHSHPVSSSATLRGAFIREALLCQQVPLPPSDLNTAIPQPSATARTLKDRLLEHMSNPSCFGCHHFIDPPGFGLENFDGIGRFRSHDNEAPIDASGELDGKAFDGPVALYALLAGSEDYRRCVVQKLYGFANGHRAGQGEYGAIDRLDDFFAADGRRVRALMVRIATDPSFRRVAAPDAN